MSDKIVVSFPLRRSALVEAVKALVDGCAIGRVEHIEAWNNVFYARGYYKSGIGTTRKQVACSCKRRRTIRTTFPIYWAMSNPSASRHDLQVRVPRRYARRPALRRLPKAADCLESPQNPARIGETNGDLCCFVVDTGNEESGSALIEYTSDLPVVYTQDFIVRRTAGSRGDAFLIDNFAQVVRGQPRSASPCRSPPRRTTL